MTQLEEREAQALAIAGLDRDELDESNPIIYAESGPCRFQSITYFFPEEDGVEVVQDLDHEEEEPKIYYFEGENRTEITNGALYEWALEQFYKD